MKSVTSLLAMAVLASPAAFAHGTHIPMSQQAQPVTITSTDLGDGLLFVQSAVEQGDVFGGTAQHEAARGALARPQKAFAGQLLKDLRQKVRRDVRLLGDILDHGVLAFGHIGQIDNNAALMTTLQQ